jgi:hypothetical protein
MIEEKINIDYNIKYRVFDIDPDSPSVAGRS